MNDRNRHSDSNRPRRGPSGSEGPSDGRLVEVHSQLSRDKDEPAEGFSLTPIFIVFLFCGFGFWAGVYLTNNAGGFSASAFDLDAPKVVVGGAPAAFEPDVAKGEQLFLANCAACHQATGLGVPGAFPPLAKSAWVAGSEERVIKAILAGLAGEIEVNGVKYNGNMPNIGAGLKDAQVANIATYVRQAWGNTAEPVMDTKVAEVRKAIGNRAQYNPADLLKEHPLESK
ncbi:MAG: cytochrome c [Verrucomicrobia bacterium]|jgi:mono/diheme cytochrome c family protein|nr:MAG: cytochrome c [Verrucomicrobiota bacterium]